MNAILLGTASLGALLVFATRDPQAVEAARVAAVQTEAAQVEDRGSMTHTTYVDPKTGETTEVSVIAFVD